jgi:hypothetical protein
MNQFVVLFRQVSGQLSEADLKNRSQETRVWAQHQNAAGHKLEPCILAPEVHRSGPDGRIGQITGAENEPVTALLFLEVGDLAQAADIARSHPAVSYGASVEVRPWSPPPAPQSSAQL